MYEVISLAYCLSETRLGNDKENSHTTLSLNRKPASAVTPPADIKEVNEDNKGEKKKSKKPLDPTQWFAYLPSPALKQSQTNFNSGKFT
jgi:hypothetical protein